MPNEDNKPSTMQPPESKKPDQQQLQSLEIIMSWPSVAAGTKQFKSFWSNPTGWMYSKGKDALKTEAISAGAQYFEEPLRKADDMVAARLRAVEEHYPMVKEPPQVLAEAAKESAKAKSQLAGSTLLEYGSWAAGGVAARASGARELLGRYGAPPAQGDAGAAQPPEAVGRGLWSTLSSKFFGTE